MTAENPADTAKQIARHSLIVSFITLISRGLGLLRDMVLVYVFGAFAWLLDAFYFAFTIPNLLRNLLGEGALTAAFIPEFMRDSDTRGKLASAIISWLIIAVGAVSLVGAVACFTASHWFATDAKIRLTLVLLAITLPFAALICCSAIMGAILQCLKIFAIPAAMSCFLNIFIIAVALFGRPDVADAVNVGGSEIVTNFWSRHLSLEQLLPLIRLTAIAIPAAGVAQLLIQYPVIRQRGVKLNFGFAGLTKNESVRKVWINFVPAAIGLGVVQLNSLLDNLIAYGLSLGYFGWFAEGATTYLFLANRLMQLPLGVFALAAATTAFPMFAAMAAEKRLGDLRSTLGQSLRSLWFVMFPAAAGLIVIAQPLVQLLYQSPDLRFSDAAVYRVSAALVCLAPALPLFSAIHLFTRTFYALGDYRTPVKIAMQTVGLNFIGNLILMQTPDFYRQFANLHYDGLGMQLGEAGLALSTSLCAGINAWRLWRALERKFAENGTGKIAGLGLAKAAFNFALCAGGMAVGTYMIVRSVPFGPETIFRLERVLCGIAGALIIYPIFCSTFCAEEYEKFCARFRRRREHLPATKTQRDEH